MCIQSNCAVCSGLKKNGSHRLVYLNVLGVALLEGMALLEKVQLGVSLGVSKAQVSPSVLSPPADMD